jgi:hypothetical protein
MRLHCHLFGCAVAATYPACARCNADLYEGPFIERGVNYYVDAAFDPVRRHIIWPIMGKRCCQCRRRYWRGYDEYCCSEKCFDEWLPF